ncbi:DNA-binding protein [Arthrobacter livingstonensis]|uniref:DNA-binding protein n=1 Tax=Arthrobacter livingstonensis TaxID=670078 RepID=A0A2V5L7G2_9MICC|nr:integration host factor, actinobacterial type [Arthrobacter livingstonensis]PYI67415.1 DNA-binding protein [Arthrobacter livingstonensis]
MSLPPLSDQERAAALKKAAVARTIRSDIKHGLKSGSVTVAAVINAASGEPALGRLKVTDLLEALPGIGKVRATVIMSELGIAPTRRVRGLGIHQRRMLVDYLGQEL